MSEDIIHSNFLPNVSSPWWPKALGFPGMWLMLGKQCKMDDPDAANMSTLIAESVVHDLQHRCASLVPPFFLK